MALGKAAAQMAEEIARDWGTTRNASSLDEVKQYGLSQTPTCVVIALDNSYASSCERLIAQWGLHYRILLECPSNSSEHTPFLLVVTSLSHFKECLATVQNLRCVYWELGREGQPVTEHYRKILNRIGDGVVRINAASEAVFINKTLGDWLGTTASDGLRIDEIFDTDSVHAIALNETHLRQGVIQPFMVRLRTGKMLCLDPSPRFSLNGHYDGMMALLHSRDADNASAQREFHNSRTTMYLTTLSFGLNKSYTLKEITQVLIDSVRRLLGKASVGVLLKGEPATISAGEVEVTPELQEAMSAFCERLAPDKNISVVKDLRTSADPIVPILKQLGAQGAVCFSLHVNAERLGCAWAVIGTKLDSIRERGSMLVSTGVQVGMAMRHAMSIRAQLREQQERRRFYSDALAAVTGNKLVLCEHEELDSYWRQCPGNESRLALTEPRDVPESRHLAEKILQDHQAPGTLVFGLVTCVSEAATNVVKYGPPGTMRVKCNDQRVWLRFDDCGPGITVSKLPKAILAPGYSDSLTPSLGLGFSLMLKLCKTLRIATGSKGTYLLIEAALQESEEDPLAQFVTFG